MRWRSCARPRARNRRGRGREQAFELKLSHRCRPRIRVQKAMEEGGGWIEQESGGTIEYRVYPASSSASRSTVTTWRATASATSLTSDPAISPAASRCSPPADLPFLFANTEGGSGGLDAMVPQIRRQGDEGRRVLLRLRPRAQLVPFERQEDRGAGDIKGMKIRPAHATMATFVTPLSSTNVPSSAPKSAMSSRRHGRCGHLAMGFNYAVRHRQGHEVPHGRATLHHELGLGDEQSRAPRGIRRRSRR